MSALTETDARRETQLGDAADADDVPVGAVSRLRAWLSKPKPRKPAGWRRAFLVVIRMFTVVAVILRTARWLTRRAWAHRRMLAPLYTAAVLLGLAAALHPSGPRRGAGTAAALAAAVGVWVAWRVHRNQIIRAFGFRIDGPDQPRWLQVVHQLVPGRGGSWRAMNHTVAWAWCTYSGASAWFIATAGIGVQRPMFPGGILVLTIACGWPWWNHYRIRPLSEIPVNELMQRWQIKVARKAGPIPGSALDPVEQVVIDGQVAAHTAEGELDDEGTITCLDVSNAKVVNRVALIYRTNPANIAIEPTEGREAHRFRWWFFTLDPLEKVIHWAGSEATFDPETGLARVGRYRDGKPAHIRFYRAGFGVVFLSFIGTTGGGKSETENMIQSIIRDSPIMVSLIADPQYGQSLPAWKDAVHGYARGPMQCLTLLRAVRAEAEALNRYLANVTFPDADGIEVSGVPYMDPARHNGPDRIGDRDLKIICLTIAEAGKLLAIPEAKELLEEASELFRKCGILLIIDIQGVLMDQMKSRRFRKMMFGGNVALFRSDDPLDQSVAFGKKFTGDPCSIQPEFSNGATTAGLAYLHGPEARPAAMRFDLCENPHRLARKGELTPWEPLSAQMRAWIADEPGVRDGGSGEAETVAASAAGKPGKVTKKSQIFHVVTQLEAPASTGEIAKAAGAQFSTTSKSLGELADAGKIVRVRDKHTGQVITGMWFKVTEPAEDAKPANVAA